MFLCAARSCAHQLYYFMLVRLQHLAAVASSGAVVSCSIARDFPKQELR